MICDVWDVAVVPFPLADPAFAAPRPVLVLSARPFNEAGGQSVLAMITTAANNPKAYDVRLTDLAAAGLPAPSVVRWKIFTLENALIWRKIGVLGVCDREAVKARRGEVLEGAFHRASA